MLLASGLSGIEAPFSDANGHSSALFKNLLESCGAVPPVVLFLSDIVNEETIIGD